MIAPHEALQRAIETAAQPAALDDLARLVWRGLSEGVIDEEAAQGLSEQIASRRPQSVTIGGSLGDFTRFAQDLIRPRSALETGAKPRGNVCTSLSISERARRLAPHGFQADRQDVRARGPSLSVEGEASRKRAGRAIRQDRNTGLSVHDADRGRRRKKAKRAGKRGPKGSTRLTWEQVKEIDGFAHICRSDGVPLNWMATIRAPYGVEDGEGKKAIRQLVGHIRQDFEIRDTIALIAVIVYEKSPRLHAHVLLHVPRGKSGLITKRNEGKGGAVHVRPADAKAVEYVTKQRQKIQPEYERAMNRFWERSARIEGPRYTYTTAAKAILSRHHAPPPSIEIETQAAPILIDVPPSPPTTSAVQLALFDDLPQLRADEGLPAALRDYRQQVGMTQATLAAHLGIRQPHLANVERRHDHLSPARRRAARYHLERLAA